MKTLFLHPPSFDGFDGGAGARYQMKREVRSFWYPTWLAQPAALVEGSKLIDAPPHDLKFEDIVPELKSRDLVVMHTSTPSFKSDVKTAEMIKARESRHQNRLHRRQGRGRAGEEPASPVARVDFVARNEFDFTIKEVADGRAVERHQRPFLPQPRRRHRSQREPRSSREHGRAALGDAGLQARPHHREIFRRLPEAPLHLVLHGPRLQIALHLLPVAADGGRTPLSRALGRKRRGGDEVGEGSLPAGEGVSSSTTTRSPTTCRASKRSRSELGKLGVTWSCNAKANVPRKTLEIMKDNGLRLLLVGYESGNQQILFNIKKGMRVEFARRFTKDCHELGIVIHGTFILGLPGETRETIQETLGFRQGDQSAHHPGVARGPLSRHLPLPAGEGKRLAYNEETDLLTQEGTQIAPLNYPHLSHSEIFDSVEEFYKKFYFRPSKIASIVAEMIVSPGHDEAPAARGCGVLPASCARGGTLREAADRHGR